jgi:hypothetical protein
MKGFLAAGDVLINPALLAYATVETDSDGLQLRLGFAGQAGAPQCEIRLEGLEARSVLRWLRSNTEFLDAGSSLRRELRPSRLESNLKIHQGRELSGILGTSL